ncbi:MAG TPA: aminotransferase class I/II-fold pyridoxal phosphate-dependent enzyme, partial [Thermodesulfobacteriota bacterium]|nr:aminotransferase class I/II-fold pyridoxal phosphate-dependent enzyme [Thermodesulfobacteriota bacterium]
MKTDLNTYLQTQLEQIREKGLYRSLRSLDSAADAVVMADGRRLIQFSSNNYLGFANHPVLRQAAANALEQYGVGVGASRLIAGNCSLYQKLEERLMRFKETEAALVFPTGYQANLGVI